MTTTFSTHRISRTLLALSIALSALAFGLWGVPRGIAASIGAGISLLNWAALRWLGGRILQGNGSEKLLVSLLMIAKIGLLIAIVFVLIRRLAVDPVGLAFGLSVLFLGPVVASLMAMPGASSHPAAERAAREER